MMDFAGPHCRLLAHVNPDTIHSVFVKLFALRMSASCIGSLVCVYLSISTIVHNVPSVPALATGALTLGPLPVASSVNAPPKTRHSC